MSYGKDGRWYGEAPFSEEAKAAFDAKAKAAEEDAEKPVVLKKPEPVKNFVPVQVDPVVPKK